MRFNISLSITFEILFSQTNENRMVKSRILKWQKLLFGEGGGGSVLLPKQINCRVTLLSKTYLQQGRWNPKGRPWHDW